MPVDPYQPTKWWAVIGPNNQLWCETSSEKEARENMRLGDKLFRLYQKVEKEWREEK